MSHRGAIVDLEVSSFSAVDPVSCLGCVSVQSLHQHCIFHIHTPPILELCQTSKCEPE